MFDAYMSVVEALKHGGFENNVNVRVKWIEAESVTEENVKSLLGDADGILVPGGFGDRGIEGKIIAAEYAREKQCAVLRYLPRHADGLHRVRAQCFGL